MLLTEKCNILLSKMNICNLKLCKKKIISINMVKSIGKNVWNVYFPMLKIKIVFEIVCLWLPIRITCNNT